MEEPNIETVIENEGEYKFIYPSFYLKFTQSGKDLKENNINMIERYCLTSALIKDIEVY